MATAIAAPMATRRPARYERSPRRLANPNRLAEKVVPIDAYDKTASVDPYAGDGELVNAPQVSLPPAAPPPGYGNRYTGNDVNEQIRSDREFAFGRGDELFQNAKDRARDEGNLRNFYRQYGDEVYDPMIGGRGGYSPEEANQIVRAGDFGDFMTNDGSYLENFLSDEERNAIMGNPWDRAQFFNPDVLQQRQDESAARQREGYRDLQSGLDASITDDLNVSDQYGQGIDETLTETEGRVRGYVDPTKLRASEESLGRIKMSPEEEERIVTGAGISAGVGYRAAADELDRKARAAGVDPLGAAAMRAQSERAAAADAGDAMTLARIRASSERAGREQAAERLRMGGEQAVADIGTGTELALGRERIAAGDRREQLRLGAARDIAGRKFDAAATGGQARIGTEAGINAQQRQVGQFNAGLGTDIATGIERDVAERNRYVSGNRADTSRANQQQRFQQGMTRTGFLSDANRQVAGARRQDAAEGRDWLRTQSGVSNQNQQNEFNRQGQVYATQGGLAQGAAHNQLQQNQLPKMWERLISAGAEAAGAVAGFRGKK